MSESELPKLQCVHAVPANQLCHQCSPEAWNKAQRATANPMKKLAEMLQEAGAIPVIDGVSIYEDHVTMPKVRFQELVAESAALRAEIAKLTLLSDSQLANQERLAEELTRLRARDQTYIYGVMAHEEFRKRTEDVEQKLNAAVIWEYDERLKETQRANKAEAELATERANQERLVGEMQELRQAANDALHLLQACKDWPDDDMETHWQQAVEKNIKSLKKAVTPKDTPTEPTLEK